MSAESQRNPRRWRRIIIVILGLAALLLIGSYATYQRSLNRKLRTNLQYAIELALDDIRSEGLPATLEELAAWASKPPLTENAADLLSEATNHFHRPLQQGHGRTPMDWSETDEQGVRLPIVGNGNLPPRTDLLSNAVVQVAAELLATNSEALAILHQASAITTCRFPIDWTSPCGVRLPHLAEVRYGAKLLQLEALLRIEEGRTGQAVESLHANFGVAHSLAQEPTVISQLVRLNCNLQATAVLERLLTRSPISRTDEERLVDDLEKAESFDGLTRAFTVDRCCVICLYRQTRVSQFSWRSALEDLHNSTWSEMRFYPLELWHVYRYRSSGLAELDFLAALEQSSARVRLSQLTFPERVVAARELKAREEALMDKQMSFMATPASTGAMMKLAKSTARFRAARAALAIEEHRNSTGELPEAPPDAPTDPFTGQPLRFKKLAKGYVVYSVGEDGEDNGGTEKNAQGRSYVTGTDITFTVER